ATLYAQRLSALRSAMKSADVDAYIIPTADPHQSEYVPDYWSTRSWISGFTGSAGTVVLTAKHAGLWTDSRYFLQASQQLKESGLVLHKLLAQAQAEYIDWICSQLKPGQTVGCDFWCFSFTQIQAFDKILTEKGMVLKDCGDLAGEVWEDRPGLSQQAIYEHALKYAGNSRESKLKAIRQEMKKKGVQYFLVTALDEIAHLLNLRGRDVHCNPVFIAYLWISMDQALLLIDPTKVPDVLKAKLEKAGIRLTPYDAILQTISSVKDGEKVLVDPATLNAKLALKLPNGGMVASASPVMKMKSQKNKTEAAHLRNAMEKDGVALTRAFMWLEQTLKKGKSVTEHEFAKQIGHFRSLQEHYVGESFDAIVGYQGNGAIIHYKPEKESAATIKRKGILLVDSGGQYLDGTTDITRTIALGPVTNEFKKHYTAVLMGHIALSDAVFPEGTKGIQLDVLARQYLWKLGLNYGHGTGHGVGYFMNVHEPPQGFVSAWNQRGQTEMLEGMLTSNEPGYYKEGSYGIRTENLVLNVLHSEQGGTRYLKLETVTLFPIDTSLIHTPMMNRACIDWLNAYHKEVFKRLAPRLEAAEKKWLKARCQPV
ncbi:MAG TPA: aminopeptidase P family protein, partial [Saprospiraceae bacterium]|nr:aminopeptidase P family protein [Saprospiraceae bacterium]